MARMVITPGTHTFRKPYRIDNRVARAETKTHADMVGLLAAKEARNAFEGYKRSGMCGLIRCNRLSGWKKSAEKEENPPVVCFRRVWYLKGQPGNGGSPGIL